VFAVIRFVSGEFEWWLTFFANFAAVVVVAVAVRVVARSAGRKRKGNKEVTDDFLSNKVELW